MADTVVDSSCLINLCAAGDLSTMLPPLELEICIPPAVEAESLYLRPGKDGFVEPQRIDLREIIQKGLIRICPLHGAKELELYVHFAESLDDGEAMCMALAVSRRWILAADDRKALRIAAENQVKTITTPEVMHRWATKSKASAQDICAALERIENAARFRPPVGSPRHAWWQSCLGRGS